MTDDLLELCNDFLSVIPAEPIGHDIHRVCRALKKRIEADALLNKAVEDIRSQIAHVQVDDSAMGDNLAIALCTYFSDHPDRPDNDPDTEHGWGEWVTKREQETIKRIVEAAMRSRAEGVRDGYRLVLAKPTDDMSHAGCDVIDRWPMDHISQYPSSLANEIYAAMLSTSPTPPGGTKDEG